MSQFLEPPELVKLTGRHHKSKQISWLRTEGVAFRVNATGHPVVTWDAVNGMSAKNPEPQGWRPRVLEH